MQLIGEEPNTEISRGFNQKLWVNRNLALEKKKHIFPKISELWQKLIVKHVGRWVGETDLQVPVGAQSIQIICRRQSWTFRAQNALSLFRTPEKFLLLPPANFANKNIKRIKKAASIFPSGLDIDWVSR